MTTIETIRFLMGKNGITLSDLSENSDLGCKSNVGHILLRNDLKTGTFVKMLESLGYQLVAYDIETGDDIIIDYE